MTAKAANDNLDFDPFTCEATVLRRMVEDLYTALNDKSFQTDEVTRTAMIYTQQYLRSVLVYRGG